MTGRAVVKAASGGAARRLVQTAVVFLVLTAGTAAGVLGLTLVTNADEGFYDGFSAAHGADLAVSIDASKATQAQVAATRHLSGVSQAAGPYAETYITYTNAQSRTKPPVKVPFSHRRIGGPGQPTHRLAPGQSPRPTSTPGRPAASSGPYGPLIPRGDVNPAAGNPGEGLDVVARTSPDGSLDHLTVQGHWATRPGEIVLSEDRPVQVEPGDSITVTSAPGRPTLKVVGIATSISRDQRDWVAPGQLAALRPQGGPALDQMLYTFTHAATPQQIDADLAELRHALPSGAVVNWVSWLTTAGDLNAASGLNTPFAIAYGSIAVVLAVLIIANVVSAAVATSYRRIGALKSIGFTPAQVAGCYLAQLGVPALAGASAGTVLGNWWVLPQLDGPGVPLWIIATVPLGMMALTLLAAAVPALRAGRLSAVAAMAAGQAPRAGHGYAAHRLAGKLTLPRPVSFGLAAPFTRPARAAATLAAVTFGLTAVVLAIGLDSSIAKINQGAAQWQHAVLVTANPATGKVPGSQALTTSQQRTATAALRAQPGTLTYLAEASGIARVPGAGSRMPVTAYDGDAAELGWDMTGGAWYTGPGQVVVNTTHPGTGSLGVGQTINMGIDGKQVTARIVGEVYAPSPVLGALLTSQRTLSAAGVSLPVTRYEAALKPGVSQQSYSAALQRKLGSNLNVSAISTGVTTGASHQIHGVGFFALVDTSLIRLLTIVVAILAGVGVLNTVLMLTRERVHDLGIFKAVGMTPGQTISMVTCWVVIPAVAAAVIALPAGMALQNAVIHAIGADQIPLTTAALAASHTPGSVVHVYTAGELALLALAGLAIAVAGALGPATWAAAARTTTALRAE